MRNLCAKKCYDIVFLRSFVLQAWYKMSTYLLAKESLADTANCYGPLKLY